MPNVVTPLINSILAQHPGATVVERGKNHLKMALGGRAYALDSSIGSLHYEDGPGNWQEIDTDWRDSDDANYSDRADRAHFRAYVASDGSRRLYPRRAVAGEYLSFGVPQYWDRNRWRSLPAGIKNRAADRLSFDGTNVAIELVSTGDQLKLHAILKSSAAPTRLRWQLTLGGGLTTDGRTVYSGSEAVAVIPPGVAYDANGTRREVTTTYSGGYVEYSLDTTGLVFPIDVDPTVDVTIAADNNDAIQSAVGGDCQPDADDSFYFAAPGGGGYYEYCGQRFPGITITAGATIGSNTYSQWYTRSGTIDATIKAQDAAAPAVFASATNGISSRPVTTASVAWDAASAGNGFNTSPSIAAIIQELVNSYTYSNAAIALIIHADSATEVYACGYLRGSQYAAKIHIEYTTGGGGTSVTLGTASATASARPLTLVKGSFSRDAGRVQATASAQALTLVKGSYSRTAGFASLTASAQALAAIKGAFARVAGVAQATASAQALTAAKSAFSRDVGLAQGTASAQALAAVKGAYSQAAGVANLTASAQALTTVKGAYASAAGTAQATASAQALTLAKGAFTRDVGQAQGILSAQALGVQYGGGGIYGIGTAQAAASAQPLTLVKGAFAGTLGRADLTASAQALTLVKGAFARDLGNAALTASAQALAAAKGGSATVSLGAATMTALARALLVVQSGVVQRQVTDELARLRLIAHHKRY